MSKVSPRQRWSSLVHLKLFTVQVDQLKRELTRQIVTASQDLGRLESEKREVETKIANLHAFHANQKRNYGQVSAS